MAPLHSGALKIGTKSAADWLMLFPPELLSDWLSDVEVVCHRDIAVDLLYLAIFISPSAKK